MWISLPLAFVSTMLMFLLLPGVVHGAVFRCGPGDVTCFVAAMEAANDNGKANTIFLARGTYTLVDPNDLGVELPLVTGNITIVGAGPEATIIRATNPPRIPTHFLFSIVS
jgi:hypothetical protein